MSKRRSTVELLRATIRHIKESGEYEFAKSDFRHPPTDINPDTALELWEIVKIVQDDMPQIEAIIEVKGKSYLKLHQEE